MPSPISQKLTVWYSSHARDLPWRNTHDPYRIWVSEIMLQQTRVETVIPYYHRFLETFPDVQTLANAPEELLLKLWEGLGYYRRARNLQKAARVVMDEGGLPKTAEAWAKLPGIGRYTAAAIASIAYGEPVAVLDGNVKRVLARLFAIEHPIDARDVEQQLWTLAERLVPDKSPGDHNQAMMELGATVCLPKQPLCSLCPLSKDCQAVAHELTTTLPLRTPKGKVPHKEAVAAVIHREDDALLLWKRLPDGLLGGLWELPMVELTDNTKPEATLQQLLKESLGVEGEAGPVVATARHAYSHFTIAVGACQVTARTGEARTKHPPASHCEEPGISRVTKQPPRQTTDSENDFWTQPLCAPFEHKGRTLAWVRPTGDHPFALHRVMQKLFEMLTSKQGSFRL